MSMSSAVLGHHLYGHVRASEAPLDATTTTGDAPTGAASSHSAAIDATGSSAAATALGALLGQLVAGNGATAAPDASTVPAATGAGDAKLRLEQALSTLLSALGSTTPDGQGGTIGTAVTADPRAVHGAIDTILNTLRPASNPPAATTAAAPALAPAPATPAEPDTTEAETTVKPNLDALNRVLSHYRAQSDAVNAGISLYPVTIPS